MHYMRNFLLLAILLFSNILYSQEVSELKFDKIILKNGLRVILYRDNARPIVSISVMYHVGSKDEKPDRTGFAHFFEHLMFEGTKNIPSGTFYKLLQNAGADFNANTSFDRTYYEMTLPSHELPLGLWVERERMLHARIDKKGVDSQRKIVKEERKERLDNQLYGTLFEEIVSLTYKDSPYRWLPIGSAQYIDKASLKEFKDFYKTYYTPENAVLVIAGDFNPEKLKSLLDTYFSTIPGREHKLKRIRITEKPITKVRMKKVYSNVELPALAYSYLAPDLHSPDYYPFLFLTYALSKGESSRLNKNLKEKKQLALSADSYYQPLQDSGFYVLYCIATNDKTYLKIEKEMDIEVNYYKENLFTDREIEKIRNQLQKQIIDSKSTLSGIAESFAEYETYYGDPQLINTEMQKITAVTPADIQRVAVKYLKENGRVVLHYLPNKYTGKKNK